MNDMLKDTLAVLALCIRMFKLAQNSAVDGVVTKFHERVVRYDALRKVVAGFLWGIVSSFLRNGGKDKGFALVGQIAAYAARHQVGTRADGSCFLASDDQKWYNRPFSTVNSAADARIHAVLMCVYYCFTVYLTSVRSALNLFGAPLDVGAGVKIWDLFNLQQALAFSLESIPKELDTAMSELFGMLGLESKIPI
jgi:hypothetical protein